MLSLEVQKRNRDFVQKKVSFCFKTEMKIVRYSSDNKILCGTSYIRLNSTFLSLIIYKKKKRKKRKKEEETFQDINI